MNLYNQKHIQNYYNEYGELETLRWEKSIIDKVKYEIHLQILTDNINENDKVLELGAGTGMFTKEIIKITSDLIVTDLSPIQLDLNKKRAKELEYFKTIKSWDIVDIIDLTRYEDNSFDKIVCFGGPLSYVFEKKLDALKEFKRVLKPNGIAIISVMNI
jgi:ubiquinone/menaquinone biosynthesis C-methylase UbiE